jgi:hypothetical protein
MRFDDGMMARRRSHLVLFWVVFGYRGERKRVSPNPRRAWNFLLVNVFWLF